MEIAINGKYGGFSLSQKALLLYCERKYGNAYVYITDRRENIFNKATYKQIEDGIYNSRFVIATEDLGDKVSTSKLEEMKHVLFDYHKIYNNYENRTDPVLINVIKELGYEANGTSALLKIVDIPDDVDWTIEEDDGWEQVVEKHRKWS